MRCCTSPTRSLAFISPVPPPNSLTSRPCGAMRRWGETESQSGASQSGWLEAHGGMGWRRRIGGRCVSTHPPRLFPRACLLLSLTVGCTARCCCLSVCLFVCCCVCVRARQFDCLTAKRRRERKGKTRRNRSNSRAQCWWQLQLPHGQKEGGEDGRGEEGGDASQCAHTSHWVLIESPPAARLLAFCCRHFPLRSFEPSAHPSRAFSSVDHTPHVHTHNFPLQYPPSAMVRPQCTHARPPSLPPRPLLLSFLFCSPRSCPARMFT